MTTRLQALRHNKLLLPLYVPSLLFAIAQSMLIPVMPTYANSFQISYALVGVVLAAETFGTLMGDVPAGVILRRLGQKRVMLTGIGVAGFSITSLYIADSVWLAVLLLFMTGLGIALYSVARHTYLAESVSVAKRGRAIAIFGGIFRIGGFVGPVMGGFLAEGLGLRMPFVAFGIGCLLAFLAVVFFFNNIESDAARATDHTEGLHLLRTVREHYHILLTAGMGQMLGQMIRAGRRVIVPLYATDVLNLDLGPIGIIVGVGALIDVIMFYPAGMIMDRFGRKFAIVPCFSGQAIGMALIPFITGPVGLILANCLMGFTNGLGSGTMMTLGSDLAPPGERGEFLGVWRLIGDTGFTGAPLIVGGIADLLMLSTAIWVIAGAGFASALIFGLRVPETLKKPEKSPRPDPEPT